jgi:hypothetical protein
VAFYFVGPTFINQPDKFFNDVLIISLADSVLVVLFVIGLYRVNYFLYHDHIEIKHSLRKPIRLEYKQIKKVIEVKNDKIFLIFGVRPSFKLIYEKNGKLKNYRVRVASHNLFKLILENEKKISVQNS